VSRPPNIPLPDVPGIIRNRHVGEEELWNSLVETQFTGLHADIVRTELARIGLTTVSNYIRNGWIHSRSAKLGRPLARDFLRSDGGIGGLANLIVAHALRLFQDRAIAGKGWNQAGGGSMADYFVGTCMLVATTARRDWRPDYDPKQPSVALTEEPEARPELLGEAAIRQLIWEWTNCSDEQIFDILQMRVQRFTYAEIAAALGETPRAIEGKLTRFLRNLRDRTQE
jgi:hypothetical protein